MKRAILLGCVAILIVAAAGVIGYYFFLRQGKPYQTPPITFDGPSDKLQQTVIVPTLDTPMPKGKNVIWCGTIQLAWNRLQKDVLHAPPAIRGAQSVVERLNRAKLDEADLPPDACLATAGFIKDGIAEKVAAQMKQRFQKEVQFDPMKDPKGILSYFYLQTDMPFTIPFFDNEKRFIFRDSQGKETAAASFGIREEDDYAYDRLRDQVELLYLDRKKDNPEQLEEFVVDPCRNSSPNQLILACIPPKESLLETLQEVQKKILGYEPGFHSDFGVRDVLLIPNFHWEIQHRFNELEGEDKAFLTPGFEGYYFTWVKQGIRFKLDRSGAELASEFKAYCKPMASFYIFDRPFLLYMKKRGSDRPFFVMWIDNAELLCKQEK
jgi:hypothetical protein